MCGSIMNSPTQQQAKSHSEEVVSVEKAPSSDGSLTSDEDQMLYFQHQQDPSLTPHLARPNYFVDPFCYYAPTVNTESDFGQVPWRPHPYETWCWDREFGRLTRLREKQKRKKLEKKMKNEQMKNEQMKNEQMKNEQMENEQSASRKALAEKQTSEAQPDDMDVDP